MPRLGRCGPRRIVWDFFGAVTIVRRHLDTLGSNSVAVLAMRRPLFLQVRTAYFHQRAGICRTGSEPCTGWPTAVADLLQLDNAGVVDIGVALLVLPS